jgi:hypothetical protein
MCDRGLSLRQFLRKRRLEADDESFEDIDPAMHARLESFIRLAFPYNFQSKKKKSALDLINAYNDQLPANETPAEMMFRVFQKSLVTKQMFNAETDDDALAEMGKERVCYRNLSLRRCMQLRPDYSGFIRWCINWCVSCRRGCRVALTRKVMEAAWRAACNAEFLKTYNVILLNSISKKIPNKSMVIIVRVYST